MVALNISNLRSLLVDENEAMLPFGNCKNDSRANHNTALDNTSPGKWNVIKDGAAVAGLAALVSSIEQTETSLRVRFEVVAGAYVDIEFPRDDFESLQLTQNDFVVLAPRETRASGSASIGPARVLSSGDQESDCTQFFPTGP